MLSVRAAASESEGAMKRFLAVLPALMLCVPPVLSADAKPTSTPIDSVRDLEIQVRARQSLLADEDLAPFNLGVTVRNGVAIVWGPVSSPEMQSRALKTIENVRGIYRVKSQLYVSQTAGLLIDPGAGQFLPDVPQQTSSAMPEWGTGKLPPLIGQLAVKKIGESSGTPKLAALMPPVAVADDGFDGNLANTLEKIRKGDERYRTVQYEIKNGAIYLRGPAKPENVMAFAKAISNVPGVERVVVQNQSKR